MTSAELHRVKKRVMADYERYSSTDLAGMITDCQVYLDQSSIIRLAHHEIGRTGDEQVRFITHCEPASLAVNIKEIAAELERIWLNDLRFTEEAHTVSRTNEEVVLDFVTWWTEPTGTYVTGRFVVDVSTLVSLPQDINCRKS